MSLATCFLCLTPYAGDLERCPNCGCPDRAAERTRSALPYTDVVCRTETCRAAGTVRRIYLRAAVPGVVEMPQLLLCLCCGMAMHMARLAVGPHVIEEDSMPKISVHGGPSNASAEREHQGDGPTEGIEMPSDGGEVELVGDGTGQALPLADEREEGGEDLSAGNSSSTSPEKPPTGDEQSETPLPRRARTTANRSKKARAESSTADSTDTSGPETP
jgi:hypothetical protein